VDLPDIVQIQQFSADGCINSISEFCFMFVKKMPGGGVLYSDTSQFSGNNIVYVYPDNRTALKGHFDKAEMVSSSFCEVVWQTCSKTFMIVENLDPCKEIFEYSPATKILFCSSPLQSDPYEEQLVEVKDSLIVDAGQGLFAKKDVEQGTVISFYNGVRVDHDEDDTSPSDYNIAFDTTHDIDVPDDMARTETYKATLAHKACHSFDPNCDFEFYHHPRFGPIRCLVTTRRVAKYEEVTVNYR